ncbi:MAG: hypothetical protein POELPBGB_01639 [Bacteroidia bacterium]|nr:hypothetical protein [Bacteroidia bacterium]
MDKIILKKLDYIYFLFFFTGVIFFSFLRIQIFFLLIFFLISFYVFSAKPEYLIFFYIVLLPTNGIIDKEHFLFSFLGLKQIVAVFSGAYLYGLYKNDKKFIPDDNFQLASKTVGNLILLFILYNVYTYFKNAYWGLQEYDYIIAFNKSANNIIMYFPLFQLSRLMALPKLNKTVSRAIIFGIANMIIFTFISPQLSLLGIKSVGTQMYEFDQSSFSRYVGVTADGDSNTMGVFFVLCIGFFLNQINNYSKSTVFILIGLCLVGVALSGSRTAFFSLVVIIFLFFTNDKKSKKKFQLSAIFVLFTVISFPLWSLLIDRLALATDQLNTESDSNRIGKWLLYFDFILSNPITFLAGTNNELKIGWGDVFYSAHNMYIQILYNAGLFFVLMFVRNYYKIIIAWRKIKTSKNIYYIMMPFLFLTFFVSDMGIFYYFIVFLFLIIAQEKPIQNKQITNWVNPVNV